MLWNTVIGGLREAKHPSQGGNLITVRCLYCFKEIETYPSKPRKLCSAECRRRWRLMRMFGESNPAFKGGKVIDTNGYIRVRGSAERKFCYEHQQVMMKFLGRKLEDGEEIHHINGDKTDNRLENLFLVDKRGHSRGHFDLFVTVQKLEWENKWLKQKLLDEEAKVK